MTDPEQVRELFDAACELPPGEHEEFLARECRDQPGLLRKLQALLASEARADASGFLGEPALHELARRGAMDLAAHSQEGEVFGRYRILKLLGAGGMGEVYLAEDVELKRQVALKIVKNGVRSSRLPDQCEREGRILAQLSHDHIARLLDAGTNAAGVPFLVMEYIDGRPLTEHCDAAGLTVAERLDLFRVVCSAVQYAHQNVVVHRDLKPGNILVTAAGQVKLLDFGIAKLLNPEVPSESATTILPALTPEYASPEQIKGELTTTATDIYSLGVVLYELLTGTGVYQLRRRTNGEMMQAIREQEPRLPSMAACSSPVSQAEGSVDKLRKCLRGDLDHIVLRALRKEPQARYSTVEQFSEDIGRHREGLPVLARRGTFSYRAAKFVRRNRVAVIAAAVAGLTVIAGVTAISWEARVAIVRGIAAQKRFEEARKLAHAVLFDYHDSIASLPGSTLVRQRLVTDALTYLNAVSKEAVGDSALQLELASAYVRVGDVQGKPYAPNLGQTDAALLSYRNAQAILESMVHRDPGNRDAQRQLATVYERIGSVQVRKFQFADAQASQRLGLAIREKLSRQDPRNAAIRMELAASHLYLGDALQASCFQGDAVAGCLRDALQRQRLALEIFQDLSHQEPSDFELRRRLAEAYMKVGFRLRDIALFTHENALMPQSLESQQKAMAIRAEVAEANPTNARDRRNLADERMLLADAQAAAGDSSAALAGYRMAVAMFEALYGGDPANAEARRDLSFSHFKLAQALVHGGKTVEAFREYEVALNWAKQLLAEDPNNAEDRQQVAGVYLKEAEAAELIRDFPRAIELYTSFVKLSKLDISAVEHLAELNMQAAQSAGTPKVERRGFWLSARDGWRECLDILRAQGGPNPPRAVDRAFWNLAKHNLDVTEVALSAGK